MWYQILCPFEGASGEGRQEEIYIELESDFNSQEAWDLVLEYEDKISVFWQHSIDEEAYIKIGDVSDEEIKTLVSDVYNPNFALFNDGRVFKMEYINECEWVTN